MHSVSATAAIALPRAHVAPRISMEYEGYVEHKNKLIIIIVPCVRLCVCVSAMRAILYEQSRRISFSHTPCASVVRRMVCDERTLNNNENMKESHEKIMNAFSIHLLLVYILIECECIIKTVAREYKMTSLQSKPNAKKKNKNENRQKTQSELSLAFKWHTFGV